MKTFFACSIYQKKSFFSQSNPTKSISSLKIGNLYIFCILYHFTPTSCNCTGDEVLVWDSLWQNTTKTICTIFTYDQFIIRLACKVHFGQVLLSFISALWTKKFGIETCCSTPIALRSNSEHYPWPYKFSLKTFFICSRNQFFLFCLSCRISPKVGISIKTLNFTLFFIFCHYIRSSCKCRDTMYSHGLHSGKISQQHRLALYTYECFGDRFLTKR